MIKYSWARYNGKPVHISEVTLEMRRDGKFYNISTDEPMAAYLEGKYQPHFHHINHTPHDNESYLHETAKAVFEDTYSDALTNGEPFVLEFWQTASCNGFYEQTGILCEHDDVIGTYDLTKKFLVLKVEKGYNEFRPDIQLLTKEDEFKDAIFVEIRVTHKSTEKKLSSGNRIIEITIENEDQILQLKKNKISITSANVNLFNFKKTHVVRSFCNEREKGCRTLVNAFFLYHDYSYDFLCTSLEDVMSHQYSESERIKQRDFKAFEDFPLRLSNEEKKDLYIDHLKQRGVPLKDCKYCRYVADNGQKNSRVSLFCKFLKKNNGRTDAFNCKYYRDK